MASVLKIRPEVDAQAAAAAHKRLGALAAAPALGVTRAATALSQLSKRAVAAHDRVAQFSSAALGRLSTLSSQALGRVRRQTDAASRALTADIARISEASRRAAGLTAREVSAVRAEYERAGRALAPIVHALGSATKALSPGLRQLSGLAGAAASRVSAVAGRGIAGAGAAGRGLARAGAGVLREVGVGAARYVGELGVRGVGGLVARAAGAAENVRAGADTAAKSYLGPEAYGRLGLAAKLSGTEIGKVQDAVIKLEGILAKKPPPEVEVALKAIGVTAKELRGLKPEDQLGRLGDALKGVADPADRAIIAQRLLGESAAKDLLPFLAQGSEGLEALGDRAERLGLVFDRDTASAAERLGDAQDLLGLRIDGIVNKIGVKLIPKLADIVERVDAWLEANSELVETAVLEWVDALIAGAEDLWAKLSEVDFQAIAEDAADFGTMLADVLGVVRDLLPDLEAGDVALAGLAIRISALLGPLGLLSAAAAAAGYAIGASFAEGNTALDHTLRKVAQIRATAEHKALEDVYAGIDQAGSDAQAAAAATSRGRAAADRAVAAMTKGGKKADYAKVNEIYKLAKSTSREDQRRAEAMLRDLEARPAASRGKTGTGGRLNLTPPGQGKPETSAAQKDVEAEISKYAQEAGRLAYTEAIQRGATAKEADRAAKEREKATRKDLLERAPGLVAAGTLGAGAGSMFGRPTTLGGALPISLDLGPKAGGPPPIQVIQVTTPDVDVNVSLAGARVDADLRQIREAAVGTLAAELGRDWRSAIAEVAPTITR